MGTHICLPNGGILESSSTARARVASVEPDPKCRLVRLESGGVQPPRNVESEWSPTSIEMHLESKWRPNPTPVSLGNHKKVVCK